MVVMTANLRRAPPPRGAPVSARAGDPEFYRGDAYVIDESIGFLQRKLRIAIEQIGRAHV
jgi:hypothetical protein